VQDRSSLIGAKQFDLTADYSTCLGNFDKF